MTKLNIPKLRELLERATRVEFQRPVSNYEVEVSGWTEAEQLTALLDRVEELTEALEFYADVENWDTDNMSPTIWDDGSIDLGKRARKALAGGENR